MPEGVAAHSVQSWCRSAPSVCPFDVIRQYWRASDGAAGRVDLRIREVVRLTEPGPAYVCPVEQRPLKLRFAEVGVGQICPSKIGICAVCRGYVRPSISASEKFATSNSAPARLARSRICPVKNRAHEVGIGEVRLAKICLFEICAREDRSAQIRTE